MVRWGSWGGNGEVFDRANCEIYDMERGKSLFAICNAVIVVEGQVIYSYDKLVQLTDQDRFKDREFLRVAIEPTIPFGGG